MFDEDFEFPTYVMNGGLLVIEEEPIKEAFMFIKWYADEDLEVEFDFSKPITKAVTLYAGWLEIDDAEVDYSAVWNETLKDILLKLLQLSI